MTSLSPCPACLLIGCISFFLPQILMTPTSILNISPSFTSFVSCYTEKVGALFSCYIIQPATFEPRKGNNLMGLVWFLGGGSKETHHSNWCYSASRTAVGQGEVCWILLGKEMSKCIKDMLLMSKPVIDEIARKKKSGSLFTKQNIMLFSHIYFYQSCFDPNIFCFLFLSDIS